MYYYVSLGSADIRVMSLSLARLDFMKDHSFASLCCADVLAMFLLLAAMIKSAQIGFHLWLPDSMEAPIPASALIHSATLVSVGIYFILKFKLIIELSWLASALIPILGSSTAMLGGAAAVFQSDLKRILAYSTISHCGVLFILAGMSSYEHTLLYLGLWTNLG